MASKQATENERREMELEALMAIYDEQLKLSFDDENTMNYSIELKDINALLVVSLTDGYPDVAPAIKVIQPSSEVVDELQNLLQNLSIDLLGDVMIYNVIEEAKKWSADNKCTKQSPPSPPLVCKFFLEGKCKFGEKCKNFHSSKRDEEQPESQELFSSCASDGQIPKDAEVSSKKSSMKTASDVISRIQWDDKIDASNFSIGYLDRFVGIIEKPFTDFSWEDIASADYNVLSIPRHRIQYFKYGSQIVWDKRQRLDNVFGSTGSRLTIYDLVGKEQTLVKDTGFEISQESNVQEEVHEDTAHKNGPNYFLAFRVQNEEIIDNVEKVQKELVSMNKNMTESIIHPQQLHVTLLMLTIRNETELNQVKEILKGMHHTLPSLLPPSKTLIFKDIGSFKDRILYACLKEPGLQKWVEILKLKFETAGICLNGNRETFFPHMSIIRIPSNSKVPLENRNKAFLSLEKLQKGILIGAQCVENVGLYSRFDHKDSTGFFPEVFHLKNSLLSVFPTLKDKVLKHIAMPGMFDIQTTENIKDLLKEGGKSNYSDEALCMLKSAQKRNIQHRKLVIILRGIPGSGKTFLLENSLEAKEQNGLVVCSPKQLFYRAGNSTENSFDQADINIAEAYCRNGFLEALSGEASIIAVDDCHSRCWQYSVYQEIAALFGVRTRVLEISCTDRESIIICQEHSHYSLNSLVRLAEQWEDDESATCIPPWFYNSVTEGVGVSLRQLLN